MRSFAAVMGMVFAVNSSANPATVEDKTHFESGGKKIAVERFAPRKAGKYPALLLLHGSDGLGRRGDGYRDAARTIAARGYVVHLVHYFDRCGTVNADQTAIEKHFFSWVKVIHDGITFAAKQPGIDPRRIGLIGYSLGGYLSVSSAVLAMKSEHQAAVIVEYFGGLPRMLAFNTKAIPPTLILHGEKDPIVPPQEARELERALKKAGVPHEVKIYPDQGHGFSENVAREAMEHAFKFLDKYLGPK